MKPTETILAALRWRYATKQFDPSKKIDEATWQALAQAGWPPADERARERTATVIASGIGVYLVAQASPTPLRYMLAVPFLKDLLIPLGVVGFVAFGVLVITGASNAVNLTDGLDGLAIGPVIMASVVFGLIAVAGAKIWVDNKVDFSQNKNLIVAAITLILGTGDFTLKFGEFALGGIGTATFGAIILYALLNRKG